MKKTLVTAIIAVATASLIVPVVFADQTKVVAWGTQFKSLFFKQKDNLAAADAAFLQTPATAAAFAATTDATTTNSDVSITATSSAVKTIVLKTDKASSDDHVSGSTPAPIAPPAAPTSTEPTSTPATPPPPPPAPVLPVVNAYYGDYNASPTEECVYPVVNWDGNTYLSVTPTGVISPSATTINVGTISLDNNDDATLAKITFKIDDPSKTVDTFGIQEAGILLFSPQLVSQTSVVGSYKLQPRQNYDIKLFLNRKNYLGYPAFTAGVINVEIDSMTLSDGRTVNGLPIKLRAYQFTQPYDYNHCIN